MNTRHRILSPAAFGIHHQVSAGIAEFIENKLCHSTFFFYEHFLEKPFSKGSNVSSALDTPQAVTAPFLSRVAYKTGFIPVLNENIVRSKLKNPSDIEVVPLNRESLANYSDSSDSMEFKVSDTELLVWLAKHWFELKPKEYPEYFTKSDSKVYGDVYGDRENGIYSNANALSTDILREDYPKELIHKVKRDRGYAKVALAKLREYELVLRPWLRSKEEIGIVLASISSQAIFWGQCIILFAMPLASSRHQQTFPEDLRSHLCEQIRTIYTPMLTLLENYIYEDEVKKTLENFGAKKPLFPAHRGPTNAWIKGNSIPLKKIGTGAREQVKPLAITNPGKVSHVFVSLLYQCISNPKLWKKLTKLEYSLVELWADRLCRVLKERSKVEDSLIFAKYLVASPAMVKRTQEAIALCHMQKKGKDKKSAVKTALVIGGPGSGKDSMAELIRLFSPGYRFNPKKTFNMAMFRPKEAAVPLLLGLELQTNKSATHLSLQGLLERAIEENSGKIPGRNSSKVHTFIMDELNSLDMDTQGALLRFLENAELQPLGGLKSSLANIDLLVIGVMNEDPQMIMKKRAMERVLRERQLFGGILGEGLYELFRNQRRLRDDLYYRFIRGGEIYIPELRDRREDLPILFYFIVKKDLESLMPKKIQDNSKWNVELPVYEELMDVSLQWEGNLRELQAVARDIVFEAVNEYEESGGDDPELVIRGAHVRKALDKRRKQAQEQLTA
ncbi:MAG: sigma 54-interacting transcriptional regulator [Gammaproteobacteria bacterium]|nr:sigma 54-interacting transcriptional regulator [Gammaproteobacteria bacterium]MCI0591462.1 sigma 54-interacting transcriptional regulator [Gammaproteobacteria bacterium]